MAFRPHGTIDEGKSVFVLVRNALVGSFKIVKEIEGYWHLCPEITFSWK